MSRSPSGKTGNWSAPALGKLLGDDGAQQSRVAARRLVGEVIREVREKRESERRPADKDKKTGGGVL